MWVEKAAHKKRGRRSMAVPLWVLGISIAISAAAVLLARTLIDDRDSNHFTEVTENALELIQSRITQRVSLLTSAAAYVATDPAIQSKQFDDFLALAASGQEKANLGGIGYAAHIQKAQMPALVKKAHEDGLPDFKIGPFTKSDQLDVVLFREPLDGSAARPPGFNMDSDPARVRAMGAAAASGQPAATDRTYLIKDLPKKLPAFLIFAPVLSDSKAGSAKTATGFVFSAIRARDLFSKIPEDECFFQLYAADFPDPNNLLVDGSHTVSANYHPYYQGTKHFRVLNRDWFIVFYSAPQV